MHLLVDTRGSSGEAGLSRREVLITLAALATSPALFNNRSFAQQSAGDSRFDLHHHFFPPTLRNRYGPGSAPEGYSPAKSLEAMDRAGIRTALLSFPSPLRGETPDEMREDAIRLARETNEYGARLLSDHKGRFGLFARLPLPDIDASLREIEYAFDTLQADGVGVLTSYGKQWLGDKVFQPVFDELNRRHAVVHSHPTINPCCRNLVPDTPNATIEFNTDTSRAIWSVINDGEAGPPSPTPQASVATRYADITFVWSHAGGSLLGLVGRFLGSPTSAENLPLRGDSWPAVLTQAPDPNSRLYHLRRFYYDTAGSANPIQMQALKTLVGSSQIVFGSDFPFGEITDAVRAVHECGFSVEELRGIDRENAIRMLPVRKSR